MAELRGVQILQSEIEKSRDRLKGFNENIKKLTGYENPSPRGRRVFGSESQDYDANFSGRMGRGRGRLFGLAKRGLMEESGPPVKRRVVGGAFSRLGPAPVQRRVREESPEDEELPNKLSVHSSVIATSREAKNRQEIMQEQTKDREGMQRNRRMFGLLLGTLNKFKTDSKTLESKAEQRKRIDKKLEDNAENERKKFKQDTKQLMEERHLEQTRISRLEQKMEFVQEHADREKEMKKLKNFLCTKTKPRIFWKPRQMNTAADNKLKDSIKIVDEMLHTSQVRLEKEIKEVMDRENKREERIKMRLREDGLFLNEEEDKEKLLERIEARDVDKKDDGVTPRGSDNLSDRNEDKSPSKPKGKRRIVIEEEISKNSSEEGSIDEERAGKEYKEEASKTQDKIAAAKTKAKKSDADRSESSDSDSDSENEQDRKHKVKDGKDNKDDEEEENPRVVLYTQTSRDKSGKESKRDEDEQKSHGDRHSHRHSKHRRDEEKVVVKEERDVQHEKKKNKSSERIVVVEDESKDKRNPMSLMGEENDEEMESEQNVTK